MHRNEEAYVNLIDLVNSLLTSIYFLIANIGFDTAENEPFNFHNFSSLQGFNFHGAVVSPLAHRRARGGLLLCRSYPTAPSWASLHLLAALNECTDGGRWLSP